ncbi:MAG: nucleotidyltransferase [Vicinamibacterales bacterium]
MGSWEDKFKSWAQSPSPSEAERSDNAVSMIRRAVAASPALQARNVKVFAQGSYRNRTNVRRESDVDVGIVCFDTFFEDYPQGTTRETFGNVPATYSYPQFKNDVGQALASYFGSSAVTRGNKAFDVKETSYHVEADVAPFFEHRRYMSNGSYLSGVELVPDNGVPSRVINWPDQHYENGNRKNDRTRRSYRALVRILKSLRNEMHEARKVEATPVIGFLSECLIWNVPDDHFAHSTHYDDLRAALSFLFGATKSDQGCSEWGEVSELKYLFRSNQKWSRQQANDFVLAAWRHVGFA